MADVVDAFVVTLGLKDDDFVRHARIVLELQQKMRKEAQQQTKETQENASKSAASFASIKREVLGLTTLILGGMGITEFTQKTIALTSNIGRLSVITGQTTEQISAWQGAIRAMGGTSEEASGDLMKITQAFEDIQLTGNSQMIPVLRQLGFGLDDLKDPTQFLLKLADRLGAMSDKKEAFNLGSRLGFSPEMVNLLIQGRKATQDYLDAAAKAYPVHQRDAQAAIEAQKQFSLLKDSWQRLGNTVLTLLAPSLIRLADGLEGVATELNKHPDVAMAAFALAVGLMGLNAVRAVTGILGLAGALRSLGAARIAAAAGGEAAAGVGLGTAAAAALPIAAVAVVAPKLIRGFDKNTAANPNAQLDPLQGTIDFFTGEQWWMGGKAAAPAPAAARAPGAPAGGSQFDQIVAFFQSHGATLAGAQGIAAGVSAEGAPSPTARDQYDSKGRYAYGLFQMRGAMQKALFAKYGPNANMMQQLQFVLEQFGSDPSLGGAAIFKAGNAKDALQTFISQFLRPGSGSAGDLRRGERALQIGTLNVYAGAGADGRKIARDVQAELIAQGNRGMS